MICKTCGKELSDLAVVCPGCGKDPRIDYEAAARAAEAAAAAEPTTTPYGSLDYTCKMDPADIEENKGLAVLSYVGLLVALPLFIIPLLLKPNSKFCLFHINQALVLLIAGVIYSAVSGFFAFSIGLMFELFGRLVDTPFVGSMMTTPLSMVLALLPLVLVIWGIVNAATGKAIELPLIGRFHLVDKKL